MSEQPQPAACTARRVLEIRSNTRPGREPTEGKVSAPRLFPLGSSFEHPPSNTPAPLNEKFDVSIFLGSLSS